MALDEYRRKRKFDQTPEPRGDKAGRSKKGPLRFVVQMHKASRLHFDFRLELGGVLKSWAVPRGPSLSPLDQRLAVYVEDHPIEYGDFEGIIPGGNYGAGTVVLWDQGTYVERGSKTRAESEARLRKGLAEGHLTFILSGEKLRGEFALVRLKKSREPNAWLLLKKRDEHAIDRPDRQPTHESVKTGRTLEKIAKEAAGKGEVWIPGKGPLKTSKTAPKSKPRSTPKHPPTFASKTRAHSVPASPPSEVRAAPLVRRVKPMIPAAGRNLAVPAGWITHSLPEGLRAIAEVEARGPVKIHSKNLLALEGKHPALVTALEALKSTVVLDGFLAEDGRYSVIDLLYVNGKDLRGASLRERLRRLAALPTFREPIVLATAKKGGPSLARDPESHYVSGVSSHWMTCEAPAASGKHKTRATPAAAAEGPALTHLDKIFWPGEGTTKGDLIEYYRAVAPVIVPHLRDRPQSMHRHPNGIGQKGFFQKDLSGYYPRWIKTERIFSAHSRRTINYLLCQDERTLLYLANSGCIELNPWLSRTRDLDSPDFSVIDLDPADGMKFSVVIKVALEVKRVLDSVGLPSFCKTSGASGLHIFIPLARGCDYEFSRGLALAVCELVLKRLPELTSLARNPAARKRRLYLDCYQNSRGQTLAAAYCVRPHPGAPVSAPLRWTEVKPGLEPSQFTIRTMPKRLAALGDLWSPLLEAQPSAAALKKCLDRLRKP